MSRTIRILWCFTFRFIGDGFKLFLHVKGRRVSCVLVIRASVSFCWRSFHDLNTSPRGLLLLSTPIFLLLLQKFANSINMCCKDASSTKNMEKPIRKFYIYFLLYESMYVLDKSLYLSTKRLLNLTYSYHVSMRNIC